MKHLDNLTKLSQGEHSLEEVLKMVAPICPKCHRMITDPEDKKFLKDYGICFMCDKMSMCNWEEAPEYWEGKR